MKTPVKDLVLILVALTVILGCGFTLGKRFAPPVEIDASPTEVEPSEFVELTLSKLSKTLDLTEDEKKAILDDIAHTDGEMEEIRKKALFQAYLRIRDLHDTIGPKLAPEKQEKLKKSRETLQKVIELRFPSLLDKVKSTTGGGSKTREERP